MRPRHSTHTVAFRSMMRRNYSATERFRSQLTTRRPKVQGHRTQPPSANLELLLSSFSRDHSLVEGQVLRVPTLMHPFCAPFEKAPQARSAHVYRTRWRNFGEAQVRHGQYSQGSRLLPSPHWHLPRSTREATYKIFLSPSKQTHINHLKNCWIR